MPRDLGYNDTKHEIAALSELILPFDTGLGLPNMHNFQLLPKHVGLHVFFATFLVKCAPTAWEMFVSKYRLVRISKENQELSHSGCLFEVSIISYCALILFDNSRTQFANPATD